MAQEQKHILELKAKLRQLSMGNDIVKRHLISLSASSNALSNDSATTTEAILLQQACRVLSVSRADHYQSLRRPVNTTRLLATTHLKAALRPAVKIMAAVAW